MFTILYSFQINRFPDQKSVIPIQMSVKIVESWTTKLSTEIMKIDAKSMLVTDVGDALSSSLYACDSFEMLTNDWRKLVTDVSYCLFIDGKVAITMSIICYQNNIVSSKRCHKHDVVTNITSPRKNLFGL